MCLREREREGERNEGRWHRLTEECILTFSLTTLWFHIQGFAFLLLWREVLNRRQQGRLSPASRHLPAALRTSWLPEWLTDRGQPCIYNFITPIRSFQFVIYVICLWLSNHMSCPLVFIVVISYLEVSTWRDCERSIFNVRELISFESGCNNTTGY